MYSFVGDWMEKFKKLTSMKLMENLTLPVLVGPANRLTGHSPHYSY